MNNFKIGQKVKYKYGGEPLPGGSHKDGLEGKVESVDPQSDFVHFIITKCPKNQFKIGSEHDAHYKNLQLARVGNPTYKECLELLDV